MFPLLGWALRSEAFPGFRVQLRTPEMHSRKVKPVPTRSEEQGLRGKASVFLQGESAAACTARTGRAPKPTVGTAPGRDGEDLALPQHSRSLETPSKAAGWRGLHLITAGWGYSSAQLEVPRAPLPSTPHCPLTEPPKLLKPNPKSAPSDGQ